jgi:hypothetical protein
MYPHYPMNIKQKTYYISFTILLICLALTGFIYIYTGDIIIAILFAPPIIHWILKQREVSKEGH